VLQAEWCHAAMYWLISIARKNHCNVAAKMITQPVQHHKSKRTF